MEWPTATFEWPTADAPGHPVNHAKAAVEVSTPVFSFSH